MKNTLIFFLVSFLFIPNVYAEVEYLKDCPIHEAFITQEYGNLNIQAIATAPPEELNEDIPNQDDPRFIWIPGYWSWNQNLNDFIWVSGVWRYQPPSHQWISGYWTQLPEGWVRIRGFWSSVKENELVYISKTPLDPIDENVPLPPEPQDAYFWMPGYWQYDLSTQTHSWVSGKWSPLQDRLVYTPHHYMWREKGFIAVPGFWDWELEDRGVAYSCVFIPKEERGQHFTPTQVLHDVYIINALYPYWPNYPCFFRYTFYFHNNLWASWRNYPNWWEWSTWWCFTWQDTWWLWWWWTHPQYPAPKWMTEKYASMISKPTSDILRMMKGVIPPPNVTGAGVVGGGTMSQAIYKVTGSNHPILPNNKELFIKIQETALPRTSKTPIIRPTGPKMGAEIPKKPFFGPDIYKIKMSPQRAALPNFPMGVEPSFFPTKPKQVTDKEHTQPVLPETKPQRHLMTPEKDSYLSPLERAKKKNEIGFVDFLNFAKFIAQMFVPSPGYDPYEEERPGGGYSRALPMEYEHRETPMGLQHRDTISIHPLPQSNPPGAKVHQYPGDYSNEIFNE